MHERGPWNEGGREGGMNNAPQEFVFLQATPDIAKYQVDFKTEVVDLPLLSGENIGQIGQRG
jgi:hypothetical protein